MNSRGNDYINYSLPGTKQRAIISNRKYHAIFSRSEGL